METIQLTARVDNDGMLRVQMPDGLENTTIEATIVFTATHSNKTARLENDSAQAQMSWTELVRSLAGAWAEDFPSLTEIRTGALDLERESL